MFNRCSRGHWTSGGSGLISVDETAGRRDDDHVPPWMQSHDDRYAANLRNRHHDAHCLNPRHLRQLVDVCFGERFVEKVVVLTSGVKGLLVTRRISPGHADSEIAVGNATQTEVNAAGRCKKTRYEWRVLGIDGAPIRNCLVEIWQCDHQGAYLHSGISNAKKRDRNFQGCGRFLTDPEGRYYFRTIKPVAYPGRTPHIHFAVNRDNERLLTSPLFVKGEPGNARDGIYKSLGDQQTALTADFAEIKNSKIGELAAAFEIIVGHTPEEPDQRGRGRGASVRPR